MWRCDNVGGLGLGVHVTCHLFGFLVYINFSALFFGSRRARTSGPILTTYRSYDVFPHKDVPFGSCVNTAPNFGGQIPKNPHFGTWIGIFKLNAQILKLAYYQNYSTDSNQILHGDKDNQILFVVVQMRVKPIQDGGQPPS